LAACSTPDNLDATVASPAAADGDDTTRAQIERAERTLADCKQRLARYRTALEAGTDPAVIAQWSAEVQAEQARRDQPATSATGIHTAAERDELQNLIREAGDLVPILANADATDRRGSVRRAWLAAHVRAGPAKGGGGMPPRR
jgi:hypothetical protein